MTLITTNSGSNVSASSFTSGIDSTYKLYIFKFISINAASQVNFGFQCNATDSTSYDETITSTAFWSVNTEDGDDKGLAYVAGNDQAQGTALQDLATEMNTDADASAVGELFLFNPSSTTYVKHWYSRLQNAYDNGTDHYSTDNYRAGYINTTTAIDDIKFYMASGNMDAVIKMYGVG